MTDEEKDRLSGIEAMTYELTAQADAIRDLIAEVAEALQDMTIAHYTLRKKIARLKGEETEKKHD